MPPAFWDLKLGHPNAHEEDAELRLSGFVDPNDVVEGLTNDRKYLVLGPKGSGKSAVACHFVERAARNYDEFAGVLTVTDLLCRWVEDLARASDSSQSVAWRALLLLEILRSLASDNSARSDDVDETLEALSHLGLVASSPTKKGTFSDWKVSGSVSVTPLAKLGIAFERITRERSASVAGLVATLEQLVRAIHTEHQHFLFVDGLDEVFTWKEIPFSALSGLVEQISATNIAIRHGRNRAAVILLCRTDLFHRLPSSNKTKIRHGSGINLSWHDVDSRSPRLRDFVNRRARLTHPEIEDVFVECFRNVKTPNLLGMLRRPKDVLPMLLQYTRHTPRDLGALLMSIQWACKRRAEPIVSSAALEEGVTTYCSRYFRSEIGDELGGYFTPDQISALLRALASVRATGERFTVQKVRDHVGDLSALRTVDIEAALALLFECGAIGMVLQETSFGDENQTILFKYRTEESSFSPRASLVLHRALSAAFIGTPAQRSSTA